METEDFKEWKKKGRLNKKERENINSIAVELWCDENDFDFYYINDWQMRITINKIRVGIFTQSKKYHNITANSRGTIRGKIADFLTQLNDAK